MGRGRAALARARAGRAGVPAAPARRLVAARLAPARAHRALRCPCLRRNDPREDARPARAAAARRRRRRRAARHRCMARRCRVSGPLAWMLVTLGLAVVIVRRRSLAVGLVTMQALVLVGYALYTAS